jgi:multisubunit Na+/H+ antiporter MnhG subunit
MTLTTAATLLLLVKVPPNLGRALMVVGAIATAVVAVALVDKPNFFGRPYVPGLSTKMGAWFGLLGALLILAAGASRFATERRTG